MTASWIMLYQQIFVGKCIKYEDQKVNSTELKLDFWSKRKADWVIFF